METQPTAAANESPHPLAWNQGGDPFDLPDEAHLWRVRRLQNGSKGGAPETVYGPDGLPLRIELNTTPGDFGELVGRRGGKYRLDALDAEGNTIAEVASAYVVVPEESEAPRVRGDLNGAFSLIERMARTLADAMDRQASRMAELVDASARLVCAADSAGVTRREPPPVVVSPVTEAPAPPAGPPMAESVLRSFVNAVGPENLPMVFSAMPEVVSALGGVIKDVIGTFRTKTAATTTASAAASAGASGVAS